MCWDVAQIKMVVAEQSSRHSQLWSLPQEAVTPEDTEDTSVGMSYQRIQMQFKQLVCDFKACLC